MRRARRRARAGRVARIRASIFCRAPRFSRQFSLVFVFPGPRIKPLQLLPASPRPQPSPHPTLFLPPSSSASSRPTARCPAARPQRPLASERGPPLHDDPRRPPRYQNSSSRARDKHSPRWPVRTRGGPVNAGHSRALRAICHVIRARATGFFTRDPPARVSLSPRRVRASICGAPRRARRGRSRAGRLSDPISARGRLVRRGFGAADGHRAAVAILGAVVHVSETVVQSGRLLLTNCEMLCSIANSTGLSCPRLPCPLPCAPV